MQKVVFSDLLPVVSRGSKSLRTLRETYWGVWDTSYSLYFSKSLSLRSSVGLSLSLSISLSVILSFILRNITLVFADNIHSIYTIKIFHFSDSNVYLNYGSRAYRYFYNRRNGIADQSPKSGNIFGFPRGWLQIRGFSLKYGRHVKLFHRFRDIALNTDLLGIFFCIYIYIYI